MGLNNEFIGYQKRMRALGMYILFSEVCGAFPSCLPIDFKGASKGASRARFLAGRLTYLLDSVSKVVDAT